MLQTSNAAATEPVTLQRRIRFFCAAEAEPFELFENIVTVDQSKALQRSASKEKLDALVVDDNLGFTKDRTVSRLFDMQSIECALLPSAMSLLSCVRGLPTGSQSPCLVLRAVMTAAFCWCFMGGTGVWSCRQLA